VAQSSLPVYMGCTDVSEFEHIYNQMSMTPSCVYDPAICLHEQEWWLLVNALIVWKKLIDICFFLIKSSLLALTAAYTKFRRMIGSMKLCHRSRSSMCTVTSSTRRETSLGKSWKHTTLWFPDGSSLQVLKRSSAYHSSDVFTVIRAEARPSQRVNKKPHKVWVAVQNGTILLSADMTVPYGISSLSLSVCVIAKDIWNVWALLCIWCIFNIKI